MRTITIRLLALALLLALPHGALAQTAPDQPAAQPASAPAQQVLSAGQLDALVAPIALYPDALLSEILMASTYPLEVVEADRWVSGNKNLKGDALKAAVDQQGWDDSVKSLVATPSVLDMMSTKLSWTQQLGDAVLAQQPDVMDAIQRLRSKAQANNTLASNKQQTVSTQQQGGQPVIVIAPTDPNTLYVPYYDPSVVYGPWPYPAYPPYYWPAPGYIAAGVIATGLAFGAGYALGRWASGGYWGGGVNWGGNNITVNRNTNINNINRGNNNWTHNPAHRQGVRYSNANVAAKFGGDRNIGGGAQNRMDFRGRSGNQVLNPGAGGAGNRPNIGGGNANLGGGGNRPNAGAGNRPNVGGGGNRPGGGGGAATRPAVNRPAGGGGPGNALGNISSGRAANLDAARGRASLGGGGGGGGGGRGGGGISRGGGGGGGGVARGGGGGGGGRGGGGGGGGGRGGGGGGRRSDVRLKHDIALLGRLDDGLGFYRFVYNGGDKAYVGVMAQDVQSVRPDAVVRDSDGYLRVYYDKLGIKFETYREWVASGAHVPAGPPLSH